ncbi:MAG: C40 family peptidase [Deltaproteobacteria bacterium]|nr:C40 family peptidase [Deltaproteobacteria bacterium]
MEHALTRSEACAKRQLATRYAWSFIGHWYRWGGDDPSGFDCSGLVIEILTAVGVLPRGYDNTSGGLYKRFQSYHVRFPFEGCLAFWTNKAGRIIHVEENMGVTS